MTTAKSCRSGLSRQNLFSASFPQHSTYRGRQPQAVPCGSSLWMKIENVISDFRAPLKPDERFDLPSCLQITPHKGRYCREAGRYGMARGLTVDESHCLDRNSPVPNGQGPESPAQECRFWWKQGCYMVSEWFTSKTCATTGSSGRIGLQQLPAPNGVRDSIL